MTLAHPQLSPSPFAGIGRAVRVAVLAILLRAGIIELHHLEQIDYRQFGNLNFFALPVLEVIVLVLVIALYLGTLRRETRFTNAAVTVLMAMVINAALRIVDLIRTDEICNSQDFYKFEGFCELKCFPNGTKNFFATSVQSKYPGVQCAPFPKNRGFKWDLL